MCSCASLSVCLVSISVHVFVPLSVSVSFSLVNAFFLRRRPGRKISMKLVASKALGEEVVARMKADEIAEAVMKLSKVHLEDECIEEIDNLEALGTVTHLYLQRNRLEDIRNLESLQHLQLLSLASNDIMDLRNLTCLVNLKAFDISYNLLDEVLAFIYGLYGSMTYFFIYLFKGSVSL